MKIPLIAFVLSLVNCFGQVHNVAVGVSNNGQLSQVCDDFYFDYYNMKVLFNPTRTLKRDESSFKMMTEYSYQTSTGLEFGVNGGFGQRRETHITDVSDVKASQQYISLLPFVLKNWQIQKLQFSLGGGLPLHVARDFKASVQEHYALISEHIVSNNVLDGGYTFGISAIGRIRWMFTPKFSLMATASFGALFSRFGGDFTINPTPESYPISYQVHDRRQTGFSLPAPELSFGIGFRI